MSGPWQIQFPTGVVDASGRPLVPGDVVQRRSTGDGLGEVVGWRDGVGMEVLGIQDEHLFVVDATEVVWRSCPPDYDPISHLAEVVFTRSPLVTAAVAGARAATKVKQAVEEGWARRPRGVAPSVLRPVGSLPSADARKGRSTWASPSSSIGKTSSGPPVPVGSPPPTPSWLEPWKA